MSQNQTSELPETHTEDKDLVGIVSHDLLALRIQSLIADKGMIVASANRDLTCYGEWRTDYNAWHEQTDAEIQALFSEANVKSAGTDASENTL